MGDSKTMGKGEGRGGGGERGGGRGDGGERLGWEEVWTGLGKCR